jgi:hypothetical protein
VNAVDTVTLSQCVLSIKFEIRWPIPVAARSKALAWGRSIAGIAGSNPARAWKSPSSILYCQVMDSATS